MEVTLKEQIACARRELAMRNAVYPRRVQRGDMTEAAMKNELRWMSAIIDTLERLERGEKPETPPF